jgi:sugar/nucleoside kinase (ribokinase family)
MLVIAGEPIAVVTVTNAGPGRAEPSGAPAIAAWIAARLGTPTVFVGAVGDDAHGRLIHDALSAAGVDPAHLAVRADRPTAAATVRYRPDGSREFSFAVVDSAATTLDDADLAGLPEQANWLHLSGSAVLFGDPLAHTVEAAARRAQMVGATVSVDPNLRAELDNVDLRDRLAALCRAADVLFPSDGELSGLGLDEDELLAAGRVICRTSGADGARLRVGHVDIAVPAVASAEQVVDADGAGDTFAGATIAARLAGQDWPSAVRTAAGLVARAIAVPGPMTVDLDPSDLHAARP